MKLGVKGFSCICTIVWYGKIIPTGW